MNVGRETASFARLVVGDGESKCELDLARDYRLLPAEELAIDKVLAVFDGAEPRDFAAVEPRGRLPHLLERAKEKDAGSDPQYSSGASTASSSLR